MKKAGFTLAESLIVLAVLGVLAVIAGFALSNLRPDPDKILVRKAYKTMQEAIVALSADYELYPPRLSELIDAFKLLSVKSTQNATYEEVGFMSNPSTCIIISVPSSNERTVTVALTNETQIPFTHHSEIESELPYTDDEVIVSYPSTKTTSTSVLTNPWLPSSILETIESFNFSNYNELTMSSNNSIPANFAYTSIPAGADYTENNKFAYNFAQKLTTKDLTCSGNTCTFKTTDGIDWKITDNFNSASKTAVIQIDINGDKAPNSTTDSKPDKFDFTVDANGKITAPSTAAQYLKNRKTK